MTISPSQGAGESDGIVGAGAGEGFFTDPSLRTVVSLAGNGVMVSTAAETEGKRRNATATRTSRDMAVLL